MLAHEKFHKSCKAFYPMLARIWNNKLDISCCQCWQHDISNASQRKVARLKMLAHEKLPVMQWPNAPTFWLSNLTFVRNLVSQRFLSQNLVSLWSSKLFSACNTISFNICLDLLANRVIREMRFSAHREIFSEYYQIKPNFDCNYPFSMIWHQT